MEKIATESPGEWAMNCFDPDRRAAFVDAALDAISMGCLVNAAERVAAEPENSAQAIAASEAIFTAPGGLRTRKLFLPPCIS